MYKGKIRYQNSLDMYKGCPVLLKEQWKASLKAALLSQPGSPGKDVVINSDPDTTLKRDPYLSVHPFEP